MRNFAVGLSTLFIVACSAQNGHPPPDNTTASLIHTEFMEACQARPEYTSRKRAGTLEKFCNCIFDKAMKGLSEDERLMAAFYLYGETHDAFKDRLKSTPLNPDAMTAGAQAVGKAAQSCR